MTDAKAPTVLRGSAARNATKTHCKRGHLLSPDNLYANARGARICRTCCNNYQREHVQASYKEKSCPACGTVFRGSVDRKYCSPKCAKSKIAANEPTRVRKPKDLVKAAARDAVQRAVARGDLNRQPCERCGNPKSEAHHEDYTKPLDVIWLCRRHHGERHTELIRAALSALTPVKDTTDNAAD